MPNTTYSDDQILAWMHDPLRQEAGFRMLLEKYQEPLYWHIRRMVTGHEDANDVLQNCMLNVFRHFGQFEGRSSLYSWLFRIASNEALTFLQQRKRHGNTSLDEPSETYTKALQADPYFDGDAIQETLQRALQTLPDKQRQVFLLRYYEEMSYKTMAEVLDTSEGALKASFHHAVKKIESFFKDKGLE